MSILILGLACWIVTLIVTDSAVFAGVRHWFDRQDASADERMWRRPTYAARFSAFIWSKASYLVGCHLCTGTWIGLVLGFMYTRGSIPDAIVSGLAIKGVAHGIYVVQRVGERLAK